MRFVINNLLKEAQQKLLSSGVESSLYELKLLLSAAMGIEYSQLFNITCAPSLIHLQKFQAMIDYRLNHMPVDKILGTKGFYKYEFKTNTDVLSPRSDTEILVEEAIRIIKSENLSNVLELGVGSGCIILSLLADIPWLQGFGVDISLSALSVAKENSQILGVNDRIILQHGDWFAADFLQLFSGKFDLLVSNPPYIPTSEILSLDAEVKDYDPLYALDGGEDGLISYRQIAKISSALLNSGGRIVLEVGEGQALMVANIFAEQGFTCDNILNDLSGIQRCISLKK